MSWVWIYVEEVIFSQQKMNNFDSNLRDLQKWFWILQYVQLMFAVRRIDAA